MELIKLEYKSIEEIDIQIIDGDRGKNYPKQNEFSNRGFCLFLSASNVTSNGFNFDNDKQFITKEKDEILHNGKLQRNDIVITTRGTVGNVALYSKYIPYDNIRINSGMLIIRVNCSYVDVSFLYFVLNSNFFKKQIYAIQSGSAQPQLPKSHFIKMMIPYPPLPTQQKIAQILSSLDDKIELNNKINANLEQQAQALFKSWFVDFEPFGGEMPAGWKVGTLSDVADYYNGYAFSSKELLDKPNDDCFDVFKQGHIVKGGGFNADGTKSWFPKAKCDKLQNFILKKGDILMAMTDMKGNVAILGNTAIMPIDDKYIVNQRVGLLRAKKELEVDYPYLYLLTNEHDFLMDLRSRANSGVQVNLSSTAIKESQINVATKEDYKKFNNLVLPLFEKILANQLENTKLSTLRDTLLPKLMNGEIEV